MKALSLESTAIVITVVGFGGLVASVAGFMVSVWFENELGCQFSTVVGSVSGVLSWISLKIANCLI